MLSVVMLSVVMLSVVMLSVVMLSVVMLSVVAPFEKVRRKHELTAELAGGLRVEHRSTLVLFL